jgi:hypothetical protein
MWAMIEKLRMWRTWQSQQMGAKKNKGTETVPWIGVPATAARLGFQSQVGIGKY